MTGYSPKVGDRVRVVLEGEVTRLGISEDRRFLVGSGPGANWINTEREHVVSVEKIEPPVEFFKPGDVVQSSGGARYTVAKNGYVDHVDFQLYLESPGFMKSFNSANYTRVSS